MIEDKELLREVWQASLPVVFNLSSTDEELTGLKPDPYYVSYTPPFYWN